MPYSDVGGRELLRRSAFSSLGAESQAAILALGQVKALPRRQIVLEQGSSMATFLLLGSGRVKLERSHLGRSFAVGHRGPGQMLGEGALATSGYATETVTVIDDATALVFPVPAIRAQLEADPSFRIAMVAAIVEQRTETERRLEFLLLHTVEVRLVAFLLEAAVRWGREHARGTLISTPFTHADIAHLIGSTRETVTLVLNKLRREGVLDVDRRRMVIVDRLQLEASVRSSPSG